MGKGKGAEARKQRLEIGGEAASAKEWRLKKRRRIKDVETRKQRRRGLARESRMHDRPGCRRPHITPRPEARKVQHCI
jgi:hypothetical protein